MSSFNKKKKIVSAKIATTDGSNGNNHDKAGSHIDNYAWVECWMFVFSKLKWPSFNEQLERKDILNFYANFILFSIYSLVQAVDLITGRNMNYQFKSIYHAIFIITLNDDIIWVERIFEDFSWISC